MQYNAKFRFLFYILILCSVFILPLSSSDVRAGETEVHDNTTIHTWTTDEFHISGSDITLNGSLASTSDINACDDPGVTCANFSAGSGFNVAFACSGNNVSSSTGGWEDITTGTGGQCWSTLDVCYYYATINQVCDSPPGDFGQPNMKIVSAIDDCSTVPTFNKKTDPAGKKYCSINYTGSGTILGNTGDDMFKIEPNARAFMLYKRPVEAGAPDADEMELNLIERVAGAGAQPLKDMMLPSGPFTDYKDYKNFITNPPSGIVNVTPACTPTSVTLCSGPSAFERPVVNGVCGTANATFVDNKFGKKWWSYGGIPNNEDEATSASPTKCVKGWDTPVTLASSPPVYRWKCDGAPNGSGTLPGSTANCSVMKIVNGSCGSANGNDYYTPPASGMWCGDARSNPTGLDITPTGWTWTCHGVPNDSLGTPASCSANRNVDGTCGSADATSFYTKPTTGLCSSGTATAITGSGSSADPWIWTCNGEFSGTTESCYSLQKIDGACGPSDNSSSASAPTTGLCTQPAGANPVVTASGGSYNWTCAGVSGGIDDNCSTAPPPSCNPAPTGGDTNGTCGTAHGSTYADLATLNAASANHCLTGSATSPTESGTTFAWSCIGTGVGTTQNCSANKTDPCSSPAATTASNCVALGYTELVGFERSPGPCAPPGDTVVTSPGYASTMGQTATCSKIKNLGVCPSYYLEEVYAKPGCYPPEGGTDENGVCGSADGTSRSSAPSGSALCSSGVATAVSGSGPWTWGCNGVGSGTSTASNACQATKSAAPINGSCGSADGTNRTSAPTSGLCSSGSATSVSGSGPWTWGCNGSGGGSSTSATACKANKKINGSCGSADGTSVSSKPTSGLCSSGSATSVSGSGPWTWGCNGSNGGTSTTSTACSASVSAPCATILNTRVCAPGKCQGYSATYGDVESSFMGTDHTGFTATARFRFANNGESIDRTVSCTIASGSCAKTENATVGGKTFQLELMASAPTSPPGVSVDVRTEGTVSGGTPDNSCTASGPGTCGVADGNTYPTSSDVASAGQCASGSPSAISSTSTKWNWNCGTTSCQADRCDPPTLGSYGAETRLVDWDGWVGDGCYNESRMITQLTNANGGTFPPNCGTAAANSSSNRICITQRLGKANCNDAAFIGYDGKTRGYVGGTCPPPPVAGTCGTAHGQYATSAPSSGLCGWSNTSQNFQYISSGNGSWEWECKRDAGAPVAMCSAPKVPPGACDATGTINSGDSKWKLNGSTWSKNIGCSGGMVGTWRNNYQCNSGTVTFTGNSGLCEPPY